MKIPHYIIAGVISFICLGTIALRWLKPELFIDHTIIILLAMAMLPWLTVFFKKLKIHGVFEGETYEQTQGTTDKPLPPNKSLVPTPQLITVSSLSPEAIKILATLWKYQKQHFKDEYTKRWTFKVLANTSKYGSYLLGVSELIKSGLVVVSPENEQCMLTNEGIDFIVNNSDIQNKEDIYKF